MPLFTPLVSAVHYHSYQLMSLLQAELDTDFSTRLSIIPHNLIMQVLIHPCGQHNTSHSDHENTLVLS